MALLIALIGPVFVDWTSYRANFETEASRILGQPVRVAGTADASLLPMPSLTFTDVRIGDRDGEPMMTVERFSLDVELTSLLKGQIKVVRMALDRPAVRVVMEEDGRFDWISLHRFSASFDPEKVSFDAIDIREGTVRLSDRRSGRDWVARDLNLAMSARSLVGPYRLDGGFLLDDVRYTVQAASGRVNPDGTLRTKIQISAANRPFAVSTDGVLATVDDRLSYKGQLRIAEVGEDDVPAERGMSGGASGAKGDKFPPPGRGFAGFPGKWLFEADYELDADGLLLTTLVLRHGIEAETVILSGTGSLKFGDEARFDAVISARQVDLDGMLAGGPDAPADIGMAAGALASFLGRLPDPKIPGTIGFDVPGIVLGGSIIQNVRFDVTTIAEGGWRLDDLEAVFPGGSRVTAAGTLTVGAEPAFKGRFGLDSPQPSVFLNWWRRSAGASGSAVGRVDPMQLSGALVLRRNVAILSDLVARIGEAEMTGSLGWLESKEGRRGFTAEITAERIDLAVLRTLAEGFIVAGAPQASIADDISIDLAARTLIAGAVELRGIAARLSYRDGTLRVEKLEIGDAEGARVSAKGHISQWATVPDGSMIVSIEAGDLTGIIGVVGDFLPDPAIAGILSRRAALMSPARLDARLQADRSGGNSDVSVLATGEIGGTRLEVKGTFKGRFDSPAASAVSFDLTLENDRAEKVLSQFGIAGIPVELGAGRAVVSFSGVPEKGLDSEMTIELGSSRLAASGTVLAPAPERLSGRVRVSAESEDLLPLILFGGFSVPGLGEALPARVSAVVEGDLGKIAFDEISGSVGDVSFTAALRAEDSETGWQARGELTTDVIDFPWLAGLELGAPLFDEALRGWSTTAFLPHPFGNIRAVVKTTARRLKILAGVEIAEPQFDLRLAPGLAALENLSGTLAGGRFQGEFLISHRQGEAVISGKAGARRADLSELVWRREGRPVADGLLSFALEFDGVGRSASGVIAGLAGDGSFTIEEAVVRGVNPHAFASMIQAADAGLELTAERVREVFAGHLDAGTLRVDRAEAAVTIAAGVVRARNISTRVKSATTLGGATIDLNTLTLDSDWTLAVDPGEAEKVSGASPKVGLTFRGDLAAPVRRIDVSPLIGYLTVRAFEQEVRRIEKLQADILEKQRMVRELRRLRQEAARRAREAEIAAEEEKRRLKEEELHRKQEEKRKQEEARRKAEEARKRAEEAATRAAIRATDPANFGAAPSQALEPLSEGVDVGPAPGMSGGGPKATADPFRLPIPGKGAR